MYPVIVFEEDTIKKSWWESPLRARIFCSMDLTNDQLKRLREICNKRRIYLDDDETRALGINLLQLFSTIYQPIISRKGVKDYGKT